MGRIITGDCRTEMSKLIAEGVKVQMCVTSPPYFNLRDYQMEGQLGMEESPDEYVANLVNVFGMVKQLLNDDGVLFLNIADSYAGGGRGFGYGGKQDTNKGCDGMPKSIIPKGVKSKDLIGIPWLVAFALRADGWWLRQDIIWHKPNPMPESVTDRCTKSHEYIFLLSKSQKYFYDADAIKEPATYALTSGDNRPPGIVRDRLYGYDSKEAVLRGRKITKTDNGITIRHPDGKHGDKQQSPKTIADFRNKRSVWTVATKPYSEAHFATFPPALIEPCILAGSRKGDIVLDPFFGSGTTGEVAEKHGRDWIGIDLNPKYYELSKRRTAQINLIA